MSLSLIALAASLAASDAGTAVTQTEDATIIVTGTKLSGDFGGKSGIPLAEVPQSVQVITDEDMAERGVRSIGDILRAVPSAAAGNSRVAPYQSFSLRIRGFAADQMRNGLRQRYYEDVDASALSNAGRVEVLKGPSGVLYGQSAVGGIISIVTKEPALEPSASAALTAGSFDQLALSGDVTGALAPDLALRITGEVERSGTFVDFQDLDRVNGALSLRYAPSAGFTANLVAEYVERETQRNPGLPVAGTIRANGGETLRRGLYLGEPTVDGMRSYAPLIQLWADIGLGGGWALTPRYQYQEFNTAFTQIRLRAPSADPETITRNGRVGREDDDYQIAQIDLTGGFATGSIAHAILAGYERSWERGRFTQSNLTNVTPIDVRDPEYAYHGVAPAAVFAFDNHYDTDTHALYVQDQVEITPRLKLVAAVRHSWIAASSGTYGAPPEDRPETRSTIWQLGATYRLSGALSLYGGYNEGFDLESSAGARSASGEPLKPETSQQAEVGLRIASGRFTGSVSAFEIKRVNALTTDPDNPDFSINVGEQRVRGIEAEGQWRPLPWWSLSGGYAYLDPEITRSNDGDEGGSIGDIARHTATLRTEAAIPGTRLALRGAAYHVGDRPLLNGSAVMLPAYTLVDIGAGYDFAPFRLDVTLANLFNEIYYTASGNGFAVYPGDPRTLTVRLGLAF